MNSSIRCFLVAVLLVVPVAASAATDFSIPQTPKEGDVIQISVNGYDIQAKITSVTAPQPGSQPNNIPQPKTASQPETTAPDTASLLPADIQQGLDSFTNSNPIKSGIDTLDNAITTQAGKWFHLTLGGKQEPASILSAVTPYFKDIKNYWYLGVALIFLIILFLLWKGKKKYDREY